MSRSILPPLAFLFLSSTLVVGLPEASAQERIELTATPDLSVYEGILPLGKRWKRYRSGKGTSAAWSLGAGFGETDGPIGRHRSRHAGLRLAIADPPSRCTERADWLHSDRRRRARPDSDPWKPPSASNRPPRRPSRRSRRAFVTRRVGAAFGRPTVPTRRSALWNSTPEDRGRRPRRHSSHGRLRVWPRCSGQLPRRGNAMGFGRTGLGAQPSSFNGARNDPGTARRCSRIDSTASRERRAHAF